MPYNNIQTKLESALVSVIGAAQASIPGVLITAGVTGNTYGEPCCICSVTGAQNEEIIDTGIFRLTAEVVVRTSPDETGLAIGTTPQAIHQTRVGVVYDAVITDGIAADLSAAVADFYAYDVDFVSMAQEVRDRGWGSTLTISVVCCGSDIS